MQILLTILSFSNTAIGIIWVLWEKFPGFFSEFENEIFFLNPWRYDLTILKKLTTHLRLSPSENSDMNQRPENSASTWRGV